MQRFGQLYQKCMDRSPLLTQCSAATLLCGIGDATAQALEWSSGVASPGKRKYNVKRTARMSTYGFVVAGPVYYSWYMFLDKIFPRSKGGAIATTVPLLTLIDCQEHESWV